MSQTLATYDAALKNIYLPGFRNSLNNSNPVLTEVAHDKENVSGRKAIWSVHSGRSTSTGARAEGATLPTADRQRYIAPEDTLAYLYQTIKVTGQARHLTQNTNGAFGSALDQEMKGAEKDAKVDLARQMFNCAVTINGALVNGALGQVAAVTDSTHVTVELPDVSDTSTVADAKHSIWRTFFVGEKLDFVTASTGVITASVTITAITKSTGTLTTTTNTGVVDDDFIFRSGNYDSTNGEVEINGLRYLVGTQNYAGITAASNPVWNANTLGDTSTGVSENLLEQAIELVQTDGDGSTPTLGLAEQTQGRKLANIATQQRRYAPPSTKPKIGWDGIEVAGLNLVFDRFCPTDSIFILTPSELGWFVGLDWDWDTDDGRILTKALDGSDAVEGRMKAYVNLETYTRNAHTRVSVAIPSF